MFYAAFLFFIFLAVFFFFYVTFGKRLCFEQGYLNRISKYKVRVGVCLYLCWWFSGGRCVLCVDTCQALKPSRVGMKRLEHPLLLPKIQPCPLTTSRAARTKKKKNDPATPCIPSIPPPSKRSCGDSHIDADFPRTSAPERQRLGEKGFRKIRPKEMEEMWA